MAADPQQRPPRASGAASRTTSSTARSNAARSNAATANATRPTGTRQTGDTPSAGRTRAGTDFERLMQRGTVDVRAQAAQQRRRRRNPIVGKIAFGLAIVSAAVDASAFAVFMGGDTTFAFGICFVVVFLTLIAAILGFIAAVGGMGRWYGSIGVVLAFFANPVILIVLLVIVAPEMLTDMGGTQP
ncbi:hypothetical protein [Curtobacterium sp. VKM Ac-2922]|uniref:hypothetical protein n=1 Tax=Curtobacterium sp. VKM Ac-2922 TaxID=2929475 RepID=UPI001FB2E386|nr:hypothetical protein [Curtobacterium sp. VKM Ac-2922]MCJ1713537.1 hypothetical protein [Curtobacterium sp. VKM Ac-2922]